MLFIDGRYCSIEAAKFTLRLEIPKILVLQPRSHLICAFLLVNITINNIEHI